jgi:uncharacterized protein (DUF2336 family)
MAEAALTYSDLMQDAPQAPAPRSRTTLLKRLTDVVCLPSSRVNTFERAMTADLLVEMLNEASPAERSRTARRMCQLVEAPNNLLRRLLLDEVDVARPLLEDSQALSDADLVAVVMNAGTEHRKLVARRRDLAEIVGEALLERAEPAVINTLLRNETARLSQPTMDVIVATTRDELALIPWVLRRRELRPSQAYVMFWWADSEARRTISSASP